MAKSKVQLHGVKELLHLLDALPDQVEKRLLGRALKKGAEPMLTEIQNNAPVEEGKTRASLRTRQTRSKKYGITRLIEAKFDSGDDFYVSFYELGSSRQPARPFMRAGFDAKVHQAISIITDEIRAGIYRATKRNLKKTGRAEMNLTE